jgi:hypothetical protein
MSNPKPIESYRLNSYNVTMPDKKEERRGGARPGSGPKPKPDYGEYLVRRLDVRLTIEQHQHILSRAAALQISAAEYLRQLIEADAKGK